MCTRVTCVFYRVIAIGSLYAYTTPRSDHCEVLATPLSCGTETCWSPVASYSLDTRVSVLPKWAVEWSSWHSWLFVGVLGFVFFFPLSHLGKEGKEVFRDWLAEGTSLTYAPSLTQLRQQPGHSLVKLNRETGEGGRGLKKKKTCYNSLASNPHSLCTYCHSLCSCKKSGVSSMGWIWLIIFIPTEVSTEFYRASNIAEALKEKQTGGLLLKNKMLKLYRHIIPYIGNFIQSAWRRRKQSLIKFSFTT